MSKGMFSYYKLFEAAFLQDNNVQFLKGKDVRVKIKLEQLPCDQFLQAFETYRALLHAKQVGEKGPKIQNPVKISHKAVVLFFYSTLYPAPARLDDKDLFIYARRTVLHRGKHYLVRVGKKP